MMQPIDIPNSPTANRRDEKSDFTVQLPVHHAHHIQIPFESNLNVTHSFDVSDNSFATGSSNAQILASPRSIVSSPLSSQSISAGSNALASSFATSFAATSPPTSDDLQMSITDDKKISIKKESATSPNSAVTSAQKKHKPHKCETCGACFARKVHLQRHSLRHQVCKPYCCERCGKCFSRQDSLVRHHRLLHESGRDKLKAAAAANAALEQGAAFVTKSKKGKRSAKVEAQAANINTSLYACIRCRSIAVHCDGKQPCTRCEVNGNSSSCVFAAGPNNTTIGAAFKRGAGNRHRHDSVLSASSLATTEDDESLSTVSDSAASWTTIPGVSGGLPHHRRDTMSSIASTMTEFMSPISVSGNQATWSQLPLVNTVPHPFEMPHVGGDADLMETKVGLPYLPNNVSDTSSHSVPQLLSMFNNMPIGGQEIHTTDLTPQAHPMQHQIPRNQMIQQQSWMPNVPNFDWAALLQCHSGGSNGEQQQSLFLKQPFTGAASNTTLNATLLGADHTMHVDSSFSSPAILSVNNVHATGGLAAHSYSTSFTPQHLSRQASAATTNAHEPYNSSSAAGAAAATLFANSGNSLLNAMPIMTDSF